MCMELALHKSSLNMAWVLWIQILNTQVDGSDRPDTHHQTTVLTKDRKPRKWKKSFFTSTFAMYYGPEIVIPHFSNIKTYYIN